MEKKRMPRKKADPLLAALIARLPQSGEDWPVDRQLSWLHLMAMAFATVYGGDVTTRLKGGEAWTKQAASVVPAKPIRKPAFYIDPDGYVRNSAGKPMAPKDIDVGSVLFDERGQDGDLRSIIWADGSNGLNGKDLTISAA